MHLHEIEHVDLGFQIWSMSHCATMNVSSFPGLTTIKISFREEKIFERWMETILKIEIKLNKKLPFKIETYYPKYNHGYTWICAKYLI